MKSLLSKDIKWKYILIFFLSVTVFACVVMCGGNIAEAESEEEESILEELRANTDSAINILDLDVFEDFLNSLDTEQQSLLPFSDLKEFIKDLTDGKVDNFFDSFVSVILKSLGKYFVGFLPALITILTVSMLKSMLSGMTSPFLKTGTNEIVHIVCYGVIVVVLASSVVSIVSTTISTINNISAFAEGVFPVLLTLLASLGATTGVATYQPMMAVLGGGVISIISKVILPAFVACVVFAMVGNLSKNVKLTKMSKMFKSVSSWLIGIVFGLYGTFLTAGGISGGVMDRVGYSAAKFALSSYVPILGGYLSDGFDLISASLLIVKNAFGYTAVIVLGAVVMFPLLRIVAFIFSVRLCSAITEPLGDDRVSNMLSSVADNCGLLISALAGVSFMFFILIMLIVGVVSFV
ncbi:MAG: stage III sporulation protein AE [Clostridia bacterium]|nr:stage III sporulation protein AE [Clostridia bacterium]